MISDFLHVGCFDWQVLSSPSHTDGNANLSDTRLKGGKSKVSEIKWNVFAFSFIFVYFRFVHIYPTLSFTFLCGAWECSANGVKSVHKWDTLSVWLLIPWNSLQRYSWDHECRSPYCEKDTDSSWKANEHVSAIWKSHPQRNASSVLRQRSHFISLKDSKLWFLFCRMQQIYLENYLSHSTDWHYVNDYTWYT